VGLDEQTPNHSTISRTRRLIDVETHRIVFLWVLGVIADRGLLKGKTVGGCNDTGGECSYAFDRTAG
jgi:transposase